MKYLFKIIFLTLISILIAIAEFIRGLWLADFHEFINFTRLYKSNVKNNWFVFRKRMLHYYKKYVFIYY
jgi:hypothetical protein